MSRKFGVSTRFVFTLSVDFAALDAQLGCLPQTKNFGVIAPKNTTKIEEILNKGSIFTFLDPSKKTKRWAITMKDAISKAVLPENLTQPCKCWQCHDLFVESPFGCPSSLIKNVKVEEYYSHASKKQVSLSTSEEGEYYLTSGLLCSWECLLGYAENVKHQTEFRESVQLVYHMFRKCGGEGIILAAPHFGVLKEYGGWMTREEYKSKYDTYRRVGNQYIRMVPFGEIYEVSSKF